MILRNVKSRMKQYGLFGKACFTCRDPRWYNGSNKHTDQLARNIGLYRAGVIPDSARVQARQNAKRMLESISAFLCLFAVHTVVVVVLWWYHSPFGGRWHQRRIREISGLFRLPRRTLPFRTSFTQHRASTICCPAMLWAGLGRAAAGGRAKGCGLRTKSGRFYLSPPAVTITTCRFGSAAGGLCAEMTGFMNHVHISLGIDNQCHAECQ